ncbi:prophage replication protein, partial [Fructobacillus fructosus]
TKQVDEETGEVIKPVEERYDRSFKVFACTREELQEIADFLNSKGIQFQGTSEG